MSYILLKIIAVDFNLTKTIQLQGDDSVHEACREIREKFGDKVGGEDHGSLNNSKLIKVLDYYDLSNNDTLEFKKKHRPLKVRLMDGTLKTVIVDSSLPCFRVIEIICEKVGISNADEYGIIPELVIQPKKPNVRKKSDATNLSDDARWLNTEKTIGEQGLSDDDTIILKKRFFINDQNIDKNDPIQLNLLYTQLREAFLTGKNPCNLEETIQFGAIQVQCQYGDHEPSKHKVGFIKLKDFIPVEYLKAKDMEKKIFAEHKKLSGTTPLNAKNRFVQLFRSLKTYGFTFFNVEETNKKGKYVRVYLGVTKQKIVRLDVDTKEIVQSWTLVQLRRWAATPKSFTLDFGDYADSYYTVKTTEGEQISQLLAGYIDIILKKRKEAEKATNDVQENLAVVQEYMQPGNAANVTVAVANEKKAFETRLNPISIKTIDLEQAPPTIQSPYSEQVMNAIQNSTQMTIKNTYALIQNAITNLEITLTLPPLGTDAKSLEWRQQTIDVNSVNSASGLASLLANISKLIIYASGYQDSMDFDLLTSILSQLPNILNQLTQNNKMLVALLDDDDLKAGIQESTHKMALALATVVDSCQPVINGSVKSKTEFHQNARDLSIEVLHLLEILESLNVTEDHEQDLLGHCDQIAQAIQLLISNAKAAVKRVEGQDLSEILDYAKRIFDNTNQVIVATMTVYPSLDTAICRDQVMEGSIILRESVNALCNACDAIQDQSDIDAIAESSENVERAINDLLDYLNKISRDISGENVIDGLFDDIFMGLETIEQSYGNSEYIIDAVRGFTLSTTKYVNLLKTSATEDEKLDDIMKSARSLAEATSKLLSATKEHAKNPQDIDIQSGLENLVTLLRSEAAKSATTSIKANALKALARRIKDTTSLSTQVCAEGKSASSSNRNQASQSKLNQASKKMNDIIPSMISSYRSYQNEPNNLSIQRKMLQSAQSSLIPAQNLITCSTSAGPSIGDDKIQERLEYATQDFTNCLKLLSRSINIVELCIIDLSPLETAIAFDAINDILKSEKIPVVEGAKRKTLFDTGAANLKAAIEDSQDPTQALLAATSEIYRILPTITESNIPTSEALLILQNLAKAIRNFGQVEANFDAKNEMVIAASKISSAISEIIKNPNLPEEEMSNYQSITSQSLKEIVDLIPAKKELEKIIQEISTITFNASVNGVKDSQELEEIDDGEDFMGAMKDSIFSVQKSLIELSTTAKRTGNPEKIRQSMMAFKGALKKLNRMSVMSSLTESGAGTSVDMLMKKLTANSANFMKDVGHTVYSPSEFVLTDELLNASQLVSDSINELLGVCTNISKEETNLSNLMTSIIFLNQQLETFNDSSTITNTSYSDFTLQTNSLLKSIQSETLEFSKSLKTKDLNTIITSITNIIEHAKPVTKNLCQAAFFIGLSDENSIQSTESNIPRSEYQRILTESKSNISKFTNNKTNENETIQEFVNSIHNAISHQMNDIINLNFLIIHNPSISLGSKNKFSVCNNDWTHLYTEVRSTLSKYSDESSQENHTLCLDNLKKLEKLIEKIGNLVASPEFDGRRAAVSLGGVTLQKPIVDSNKALLKTLEKIVDGLIDMVRDPDDDNLALVIQSKVKDISSNTNGITKALANNKPGQRECQEAINLINEMGNKIDGVILNLAVGNLEPEAIVADDLVIKESIKALQSMAEEMVYQAKLDIMESTITATIPKNLSRIVDGVVNLASQNSDSDFQSDMINGLKSTVDAFLVLLVNAKSMSNNLSNKDNISKIDRELETVKLSLASLSRQLDGKNSLLEGFIECIEKIETCMKLLDNQVDIDSSGYTYSSASAYCTSNTKHIADCISNVLSQSKSIENYIESAKKLTDTIIVFIPSLIISQSLLEQDDLKASLMTCTSSLCNNAITFIETLKNGFNSKNLGKHKILVVSREFSSSIVLLLNALKEGNKGQAACEKALDKINDVVADLESWIIFAKAGQLESMDSKSTMKKHQQVLLTSFEDLQSMIVEYNLGNSTQRMGELATEITSSISDMKDRVKAGAAALTPSEKNMQVVLLTSAKNLAEQQSYIINLSISLTTANNAEIKSMVSQQCQILDEMIDLVKLLSDETSKGSRAIESALSEIPDLMKSIEIGSDPNDRSALPEEVSDISKQFATTCGSIAPLTKQEDIAIRVGQSLKLMHALISTGTASVDNAPIEIKEKMTQLIKTITYSYSDFLNKYKASMDPKSTTQALKQQVQGSARKISEDVGDILACLATMIPRGYVDLNDPEVIAEKQLMNTAKLIEEAGKLIQITDKTGQSKEGEEIEVSFVDQMLEASKTVASATSVLIRTAVRVQRESRSSVKSVIEDQKYHGGDWELGFISAAKPIGITAQDLAESISNQDIERSIVLGRLLASSTTQLLLAANVRTDETSENTIRLKASGKAVVASAEALIKTANNMIANREIEAMKTIKEGSATKAKTAEIEAQVGVLKMEQELNKARNKLATMRKGSYVVSPQQQPWKPAGPVSNLTENKLKNRVSRSFI